METPLALAQELLDAARKGRDTVLLKQQLMALQKHDFAKVSEDPAKMSFWINCYNAFSYELIGKKPSVLLNRWKRHRFFSEKQLGVAGHYLSFDDIEHSILRRSKYKWTKGYVSKWRVTEPERSWRVANMDVRLHFALNCGAASCPPIRFYEMNRLDEQLNNATSAFLETEIEWIKTEKLLFVSSLFNWYAGDFGGKRGIRKFVGHYRKDIPVNELTLRYMPYHWRATY